MKKQVHYAIKEDMEKYVKGINVNQYETYWGETDSSVIDFLQKYYDNHLPVDVTAWIRVNKPDPCFVYAEGLGDQVCFVRDQINSLLRPNYDEYEKYPPMVISTHYSKSIKLPVYQIYLENYDIEIILRYNFYNWKISVKSKKELDFDFMGLFNPEEEISDVYCEGFPKDKVYGSFASDSSKFTIEIISKYNVYTFFYLLKTYLDIK